MSEEKVLADIAVKITNIIKLNLSLDAEKVIVKMLDEIPELANDIDLTIQYLQAMAKAMGLENKDVNAIIYFIQKSAQSAVGDVAWNNIWQEIAQGIYYVARILANLLPPKWKEVILIIVEAYDRLILA